MKGLDIRYLSTTLLTGYPDCPARVMTQHAVRQEKGDDTGGDDPLRFGSVVHDVCERYHEAYMRGEELPEPLELFDEVWSEHNCADFEYYELGRENIEDFIERTLYDRRGSTISVEFAFVLDLNTLEIYPITENTPKDQWVDKILDLGHVPFVSKIDRIDKIEDGIYEVYDYKTNVIPYTRDEVESSIQLRLYDVAVRALYDDAEHVRCAYDMFRHGRQYVVFDQEDRDAVVQYSINTWNQIQNTNEPEERINKYCCWCHRRDECDEYKKVLESDVPEVLKVEEPDNPEGYGDLWEKYKDLKNKRKILKKREKEIRSMFEATIASKYDGAPLPIVIDGESREVYLRQNVRYEYPIEDVFMTLEANNALTALKEIGSISNTSLKKFLKNHPDLKESLENLKRTKYYKPTPRDRVRKPKED